MPLSAPSLLPGRLAALLVPLLVLSACGGGGGTGQVGLPGDVVVDSQGRLFLVDPNQGGNASELKLDSMFWGRLVDVHDIDADTGAVDPRPELEDFVINENLASDGSTYRIETNPVTQTTRLVILRERDDSQPGGGDFTRLLRAAEASLPPVLPRHDDGSSSPPFSFVARNACLVLQFDDLLKTSGGAELDLDDMVRVVTGYPPTLPFQARTIFDPNHGGTVGGRFQPTRVLVDLTISVPESLELPGQVPTNSFGLPNSLQNSDLPNVTIRMPTRIDLGGGQFRVLENMVGSPLTSTDNGPVDLLSPTRDVVRAFRSGNNGDLNNGFLLDLSSPRIVGSWPVRLSNVAPLLGGLPGFSFEADINYLGPCRKAPRRGEILTIGASFVQVLENAPPPDLGGVVRDVSVELLDADPADTPAQLAGLGFYQPLYDPAITVPNGCWLNISPEPASPPERDVKTSMQAVLRFSEPMEPRSVAPMENFRMIRGAPGMIPTAKNIVVGTVESSGDLQEFRFTPSLPLNNKQEGDLYHFLLQGFTDLAGNPLQNVPTFIEISVDPTEAPQANAGVVLRLESPNELDPGTSGPDLRGQFFFDVDGGSIRPRPPTFASAVADRNNPVPAIMVPFGPGVQTPLAPLGSRLQKVFRYVDFGWQVLDETRYNLDVVGLSWSPIGGQIIADFYENFEMLLSHSQRLPDECITPNLLPAVGNSGLRTGTFDSNILRDEFTTQEVVHDRSLGYVVDPSNLFAAATGTVMMPYPLNRRPTGTLSTFTWRDTRSRARAGPNGRGLPLCIEIGSPLFLEDPPPRRVRVQGQVPTFGLPLLVEVKTFPTATAIGLNALDISLAVNSSNRPNFRVFSTGGINRFGVPIETQPDLEPEPRGGFNPNSSPPGRRTPPGDNSFYIGQLDYVVRVSQVHSVWISAQPPNPNAPLVTDFAAPVVLPTTQPTGTQTIVEYRGALGFVDVGDAAFDSTRIDPYGDVFEFQSPDPPQSCDQCIRPLGEVLFMDGNVEWRDDIADLDGSRYVQFRVTFLNNIDSGESPELSAIGIAWAFR